MPAAAASTTSDAVVVDVNVNVNNNGNAAAAPTGKGSTKVDPQGSSLSYVPGAKPAAAPPNTPLDDIPRIVQDARTTFESGRTKPVAWRKQQLRSLLRWLIDYEDLIVREIHRDFKKPAADCFLTEIMPTRNEVVHMLDHVDDWAAPKRVSNILMTITETPEIRHEPLGVVLVISPWNYPFMLAVLPLAFAICAGNAVVLKASEIAPFTAALLAEWLPKILDPTAVKVVNGAVPEATKVLAQRFDHIFYTGNGAVGKIVMRAAANNLTPVVLELGGKSPVYIHHDVDCDTAATRLFWAKTINTGQTCIAPDYVLVNKKVASRFYTALEKVYAKNFPGADPKKNESYSRIININHWRRLTTIMQRQEALPHSRTLFGGTKLADADELFIAPTAYVGVKKADPVMEDELFGPLLPLIEVDDEDEAIRFINSRDRPLALYVSANSNVARKVLQNTNSGVATVNDYLIHMLIPDLPFGGVGPAGFGAYHGHQGFLTFTHQRGTHWRHKGLEIGNAVRYAPVNETRLARTVLNLAVVEREKGAFLLWCAYFVKTWGVLLVLVAAAFIAGRASWGKGL
ncbi:fatty aldehyde dehydrogenase [Zopfochytrium polystomum]|nr:fatty aldehyde dehydrogenase [Zopfochytrium polystomum]